jgi:type II secretory pathway pseudopilin PulG
MTLKLEPGRKDSGFTLIEIVLILIVISVLAAVVTPKFAEFYSGIKLSSAAKKLVNDIRYAQNLATTTRTHHKISFTSAGSYRVLNVSTGNPVRDPLTQADFIVDLTRSEFSGVNITLPTGLAGDYVEFDGLGIPYDGGGVIGSS